MSAFSAFSTVTAGALNARSGVVPLQPSLLQEIVKVPPVALTAMS